MQNIHYIKAILIKAAVTDCGFASSFAAAALMQSGLFSEPSCEFLMPF